MQIFRSQDAYVRQVKIIAGDFQFVEIRISSYHGRYGENTWSDPEITWPSIGAVSPDNATSFGVALIKAAAIAEEMKQIIQAENTKATARTCENCVFSHWVTPAPAPFSTSNEGLGCLRTGGHADAVCDFFQSKTTKE